MHESQCPARTLGQMPRSILRDAALRPVCEGPLERAFSRAMYRSSTYPCTPMPRILSARVSRPARRFVSRHSSASSVEISPRRISTHLLDLESQSSVFSLDYIRDLFISSKNSELCRQDERKKKKLMRRMPGFDFKRHHPKRLFGLAAGNSFNNNILAS